MDFVKDGSLGKRFTPLHVFGFGMGALLFEPATFWIPLFYVVIIIALFQSHFDRIGPPSSGLCARDLSSKRLLGKGLASVGYETELKGERFARLDFIGVPSTTFRKEATVVAGLEDHENVVRARGWVVGKTRCSLVLEYMEDDLLGLIQKRKESQGSSQPFELAEALDIILQIARGMRYLHEQNILHGDLKTKNILVNCIKEEERDALLSVKVADYGLVRTKRKSMPFVSRQARKLDVVRWKAPETLEKVLSEYKDETSSESDSNSDDECVGASDSVRLSGDVYSFALTCVQILTGEDPYPNLNWKELGVGIVSGTVRPKLPAPSFAWLNDLLELCWSEDSAERPAFSTIFWTLEWTLLYLRKMKTLDNAKTLAMNFSGSLLVEILEVTCGNLVPYGYGIPNPYVVVQLGRQKAQRTTILKRTLEPKWIVDQHQFSIEDLGNPNFLTLRVCSAQFLRHRDDHFELGILVVPLNELYKDPRRKFDGVRKPYEFGKRYEFCQQLDKVKRGQLRFAITVYGPSHPPQAAAPLTSDTVMCQTQKIKPAVDVVASDWVESSSMRRSKSDTTMCQTQKIKSAVDVAASNCVETSSLLRSKSAPNFIRTVRTPPKVPPGAGQYPPPLDALQEARQSSSSPFPTVIRWRKRESFLKETMRLKRRSLAMREDLIDHKVKNTKDTSFSSSATMSSMSSGFSGFSDTSIYDSEELEALARKQEPPFMHRHSALPPKLETVYSLGSDLNQTPHHSTGKSHEVLPPYIDEPWDGKPQKYDFLRTDSEESDFDSTLSFEGSELDLPNALKLSKKPWWMRLSPRRRKGRGVGLMKP